MVSTLKRTLRSSDQSTDDENDLLKLLPQDQVALRTEIREAEALRATAYDACRKLRRRAAVFHARGDRLCRELSHATDGVRRRLDTEQNALTMAHKQR